AQCALVHSLGGRKRMESFCITDGPTMWAVFLHLARPGPNYLKLAMSIILPSSSSIQTSRRPLFCWSSYISQTFCGVSQGMVLTGSPSAFLDFTNQLICILRL